MYPSVRMTVCLSVDLSIHPYIPLSTHLMINPSSKQANQPPKNTYMQNMHANYRLVVQ